MSVSGAASNSTPLYPQAAKADPTTGERQRRVMESAETQASKHRLSAPIAGSTRLAFRVGRLRGLLRLDRLRRLGVGFGQCLGGVGHNGVPSLHAHQHAVGVLDGVHMAVMLLDHLNGRAHLLREEIHVHAHL